MGAVGDGGWAGRGVGEGMGGGGEERERERERKEERKKEGERQRQREIAIVWNFFHRIATATTASAAASVPIGAACWAEARVKITRMTLTIKRTYASLPHVCSKPADGQKKGAVMQLVPARGDPMHSETLSHLCRE